MPEPSEQNGRFQFSLRAILIVFVVVASSIGMAGGPGLIFAASVILVSIQIRIIGEFTIIELFPVLLLCGIAWIIFNPGHDTSIHLKKMGKCKRDFIIISQALNNYHDTFGRFPPTSVPDSNGQPAHSWRVLILPFLSHDDLYNKYNFDEPWDGPNNKLLAAEIPGVYRCWNYAGPNSTSTNRMALVGNDTVLRTNKSLKRDEISDSIGETIVLVETNGKGVHWMEPVDFPLEKAVLPAPEDPSEDPPSKTTTTSTPALGPIHLDSFLVTLADGAVECLRTDIPQSSFKALATANGGESVYMKRSVRVEPSKWAKPISFMIFVYSSIALLYGAYWAFCEEE